MQIAWENTVESLKKDFGANVASWTWGKIHTLEIKHLLGRRKPMNYFFNMGPFPVPGSKGVINQFRHKYGLKDLKSYFWSFHQESN